MPTYTELRRSRRKRQFPLLKANVVRGIDGLSMGEALAVRGGQLLDESRAGEGLELQTRLGSLRTACRFQRTLM